MIGKIIAAIFLPGVLVVFFTRVTFSHIIGLLLTVALIVASVYKGYTHTELLFIIDAASLTVGYFFADKMVHRKQKKQPNQNA